MMSQTIDLTFGRKLVHNSSSISEEGEKAR